MKKKLSLSELNVSSFTTEDRISAQAKLGGSQESVDFCTETLNYTFCYGNYRCGFYDTGNCGGGGGSF